MKRIVMLMLLFAVCAGAFATTGYDEFQTELYNPVFVVYEPVNSGYCYYVNDPPRPSKQSSIVEERLNKNKNKERYYDPPLSRYVNLVSANEYLEQEWQNSKAKCSQFVTHNSVGVKFRYVGLEAFYKQIQTSEDDGTQKEAKKAKQTGFGFGTPNAEFFRAMVYGVQNDYTDYYPVYNKDASYSGLKAQVVKRFRSEKQFTEVGADYEVFDIPKGFQTPDQNLVSSYFTATNLDWTPKSRINVYILASSVINRYQEPNNFSGIGSAASPLLLVNGMAHAFVVRGTMEESDQPGSASNKLKLSKLALNLPVNFNKYAGIDLAYYFNREEESTSSTNSLGVTTKITEITESSGIHGGVRIALYSNDWFKLISGMEYYRHKDNKPSEYFAFSGNMAIKLTHHIALISTFKHNNLWLPEEGIFRLDPLGFHYGSSFTVRL